MVTNCDHQNSPESALLWTQTWSQNCRISTISLIKFIFYMGHDGIHKMFHWKVTNHLLPILVMSDKSWSETLCVDLSITCDNTQTFGGRCTILQQRVSESWASHPFIIINKIFALPYDIQYWLCFIFIWIEGFLTLFIEYRLLLQNIILPWTSYNCFNPLSLHWQWSPLSSFHWNADASIGCFIEFSCLTLRLGVNYTRVVKIIFFKINKWWLGCRIKNNA